MLIRRGKALGISIVILLILFCGWRFIMDTGSQGEKQYRVSAQHLDPAVLDSYPQEVIEVDPGMLTAYHVRIQDSRNAFQSGVSAANYPAEVQIFLEPSVKIESNHPDIKAVADGIAAKTEDPVEIARQAAAWTARTLRYDADLADQIWTGTSQTRSALEALIQKRGTCSEYANLFIAIMRNKGIPARFIVGRIYEGSYHAWAEIWLADQGWVPVETQKGQLGVSTRHIKLLAGRDFVDIGVPLQNISANIYRVK